MFATQHYRLLLAVKGICLGTFQICLMSFKNLPSQSYLPNHHLQTI